MALTLLGFNFGMTCCTSSTKGNDVLRDDEPTFVVDSEMAVPMPRATMAAQRKPVRVSLISEELDSCPASPSYPMCRTKSEGARSTVSTRFSSAPGDEDSACNSRDFADFASIPIPETGINLRQRRCLPGLEVQTKNLQARKPSNTSSWALKAPGHLASRPNPPFEVSMDV